MNPLANFGQKFVDEYFENHSLPKHPLLDEGFLSVGCTHTHKSSNKNDPRSGRYGLIKQKLSVEYTIRKTKMDVHLKKLENDNIYIFRQAYRSIKNISMLWSLGKDSNVMVWLAFKAFWKNTFSCCARRYREEI